MSEYMNEAERLLAAVEAKAFQLARGVCSFDESRDARAALLAHIQRGVPAPAEVPMPQGYAEHPTDYTGQIWIESQMRTHGAACRAAGEAAGYARGLKEAGQDAERYRWQPIDTAPRDGSYVLVSNGHGVWVARFKDVYQSGWQPPSPWQSMMLNHDHIPSAKRSGNPTHWMPPPAAPAEGAQG